jgi:hypothetical protein
MLVEKSTPAPWSWRRRLTKPITARHETPKRPGGGRGITMRVTQLFLYRSFVSAMRLYFRCRSPLRECHEDFLPFSFGDLFTQPIILVLHKNQLIALEQDSTQPGVQRNNSANLSGIIFVAFSRFLPHPGQ